MHTGRTNFDFFEPLLWEKSVLGRKGADLPQAPQEDWAKALGHHAKEASRPLGLPELSEVDVCRHYTRLSRWNYCIDTNTYPLGSCTMKYNPKINEWAGRLPGFAALHPLWPPMFLQGAFEVIWGLQNMLCEIGGFEGCSLLPSAGAQGELLGVMMMKAYFKEHNRSPRKMLIPKSAHGTNPATAAFLGYETVALETGEDGCISLDELNAKMDSNTAGIMLTNPNTLGIFEKDILKISQMVHERGGLVYGDGANLNALLGWVKPGNCGIDVMHFNLHKTFTTPHGGGGPGCGAVLANNILKPFLPNPIITKNQLFEIENRPLAVGKVRGFFGNFGMMVRAYTYILEMGQEGLKKASAMAVLNANYIKEKLKNHYHLPYHQDCLHEVILSDKNQKKYDITALDICKGLIDFGIHPPTMYFPLVVPGALMIEPTETESKLELDQLCEAMIQIAKAAQNPQLKTAPHHTATKRVNEAMAARNGVLKYQPKSSK